MREFSDRSLSFLDPLFTDEAWPALALLLRVVFLVGFALLLVRFHLVARKERKRPGATPWPVTLSVVTALGFALLAARQAQWQLFGRQNEAFVAFMQRYDRREFNPAHRVRAGRVYDRRGRVLAVSRVTDAGIHRHYPYGPVFAHAVGYNHPVYGMTGLEGAARPVLMEAKPRGREDLLALGAELLDRERYAEGAAVVTTLDLDLQLAAHRLLDGRKGAVVLMDIHSGDLLVLVSQPGFDPNRLHPRLFSGATPDAPMLNRALAGQYPPGSVFKVLVAAAALENGFSGTFDTPPEGFTTSPANPPIRDHEYHAARRDGRVWQGHGRIGLETALARSSNVFFAQLAAETGGPALSSAAEATGMTRPLNLWDRPEPTLVVRPARLPDFNSMGPYNLAQSGIGQGEVLVTPMHMALVTAAVARGGEAVAPRLDTRSPVRTLGRVCGESEAAALRRMMRAAVTHGTGRGIDIPDIAVAGKTGTAQTGGNRESHSWFVGFAPADQPRWAFCVLVEHGGFGSRAALPLARELLTTGLREGALAP